MQSEDRETERQRCYETALKSRTDLMNAINKLEWCASYDKNGVKSWVAPVAEQEKEFRAMGQTRINRPPKAAFDYIMDMKYRPAWDKILNEHKIEDEFSKDEHHRTVLWTMKFRPRYLKMKRRVSVFACYVGVHPVDSVGGYMISMASINTNLAPVSCDEIAFDIPISGYIMSPDPEDPNSTILTYVLRVTIQIQHLGFMERSIMRSISQWGPPHMITDRLSKLRSLIEEKSVVSVVNNFPHARDSNFPPRFLRDFEYIKKDPIQSRDDLITYYCGEECAGKWANVTTERGLVIKKFTGPLLHSRHNLALKLSFSTVNFIQFSRCLSEPEKRLIWEPCATKVEHIWDDGPMNICLKVSGGGSAKGCGSPKFDVFVYHVYSYGLKGDSDSVDSCVYEEHSDGNMLLVMLTADRPSSNIDVLFFTNTALYSDRSRTSLTSLPASPLAPIERTLLESVIEFRNVVELDTWLPTESIERLSLSTVSKVATGQRRSLEMANNTAHKVTMPAVKRKQIPSPVREDAEDAPLFGKVKNYFNKLPSFSSMFSFPSQHPIPAKYSRSNNNSKNNTSIHLLFPSSPNKDPEDDYLMNCLPYELLVHIIKYVRMEDVRACSQLCHRAWQVTNCDLVWRDQVASVEAQKQAREGWENYAPLPHFSSTPASPSHAPASPDSLFEKPVWLRASVDSHSSSSNQGSLDNIVASNEMEVPILSQEQRRQELTSLLDSVQVYSSPFKWEYLQGVAAEKCWKYGVSNYSGYEGMVGENGMTLSEQESEDTVLVGSAAGEVRGIIPANLESPSSRVLFSFHSNHSVVQVQWCGDKAVAVYNNGEIVQYNKNTKEQTSRLFITPMVGGFFFKNEESPSLLASYVGDKLRVWNTDDGSKMFKFRSSRGNITNVRLSATKCVAVTAMHALYTVNMLDLPTGNLQTCLSGHQGEITAVRLLDCYSNIVASASRDGTVRVWDLRSGIQIAKQYIHSGVEVNAFSPTNDKLVAALSSGEISYWDPRNTTKPVASFSLPTPTQPNMYITNVQVTQDNKRLLATWNTGLLSTWILYPRQFGN